MNSSIDGNLPAVDPVEFQLDEDRRYAGLKEKLDDAYVHLYQKKPKAQLLHKPEKGQSLRQGNFVPEENPDFCPRNGRNVSKNLYEEWYNCTRGTGKYQDKCTLLIKVVVRSPSQCQMEVSGCHSDECHQDQRAKRARRSLSAPPTSLTPRMKTVLNAVFKRGLKPFEAQGLLWNTAVWRERVQDILGEIVYSDWLQLTHGERAAATLPRIQSYYGKWRTTEAKSPINSLKEYLAEYQQHTLRADFELPQTFDELKQLGDPLHPSFHIMLVSEFLSLQVSEFLSLQVSGSDNEAAQANGAVQAFLKVEHNLNMYKNLFENAVIGLDASYFRTKLLSSTVLGLVLVNPATRKSE